MNSINLSAVVVAADSRPLRPTLTLTYIELALHHLTRNDVSGGRIITPVGGERVIGAASISWPPFRSSTQPLTIVRGPLLFGGAILLVWLNSAQIPAE